jgi:hypothetical protein
MVDGTAERAFRVIDARVSDRTLIRETFTAKEWKNGNDLVILRLWRISICSRKSLHAICIFWYLPCNRVNFRVCHRGSQQVEITSLRALVNSGEDKTSAENVAC